MERTLNLKVTAGNLREPADVDLPRSPTARDVISLPRSPAERHDPKHQTLPRSSAERQDPKHQTLPRSPTATDVVSLPGSSAERQDPKHKALSYPVVFNKLRRTADEQADVPVQADKGVCWPSTARQSCNNELLDTWPLMPASPTSKQSCNPYTHELHVSRHDENSCHVFNQLQQKPSSTHDRQNMFIPAHIVKAEPYCSVDMPPTCTRLSCYQCPVSDDVQHDSLIRLDPNQDTAQAQTQQIGEACKMTIPSSVGKASQMAYLESTNMADRQNQNPFHSTDPHMHQNNNTQGSIPHCLSHQENNNRCSQDTCFWTCSKQQPTSGCEGHPNELCNWAQSEDNDPLLQSQDSMSVLPMQDKCQYHMFFSHCPQDQMWVEQLVADLESPPYNFQCMYTALCENTESKGQPQSTLCAAMLSQRIVLVLSRHYVQETWASFEKTLQQLSQMNFHHEEVLAVLLEDCDIPESLGNLNFLDACAPDFFQTFTQRLNLSHRLHRNGSVCSEVGQTERAYSTISNGTILAVCRLSVHVGWNSYLLPVDGSCLDTSPALSSDGIGMEKTEFTEIVCKVSAVVDASNKLPWILSAQPLALLLMAVLLWLPAFITILVIHVDDNSGIALPIRLTVFLLPLGLVAGGYLLKWRRSYWMTKLVRLLVQNCVEVNQAFYFQGRPLFVTSAHLRASLFSIYFVYFDATDCVRNVDLFLMTCMENDGEKLNKFITFYTRDENYLSRMSLSERLTVMMSAPYLVKLVKQMLPQPPQECHVSHLLCLCQFTEECVSRFAHGFDREDVPGLAELFVRHMPGRVCGSAVRRVQEELFHASHGLVH